MLLPFFYASLIHACPSQLSRVVAPSHHSVCFLLCDKLCGRYFSEVFSFSRA